MDGFHFYQSKSAVFYNTVNILQINKQEMLML